MLSATEKLLYAKEASTQDASETTPTFDHSKKFVGVTDCWNKGQFFLGHPVDYWNDFFPDKVVQL